MAGAVPGEFVGLVEGGGGGGTAVAGVAAGAVARDGLDAAVGEDATDALVIGVAKVERAVGSAGDGEDVVQRGGFGRTAVAGKPF